MSVTPQRHQPTLSGDYYRGAVWKHYATINPEGPGLMCICKVTDRADQWRAVNEQNGVKG